MVGVGEKVRANRVDSHLTKRADKAEEVESIDSKRTEDAEGYNDEGGGLVGAG